MGYQRMILANFQRRRPVGFQVAVGPPKDEQAARQQQHAKPAQPDRQVVIRKIQPAGYAINQRNHDPENRHQNK